MKKLNRQCIRPGVWKIEGYELTRSQDTGVWYIWDGARNEVRPSFTAAVMWIREQVAA